MPPLDPREERCQPAQTTPLITGGQVINDTNQAKFYTLRASVAPTHSDWTCGTYGLSVNFVDAPCSAINHDPLGSNDTCADAIPFAAQGGTVQGIGYAFNIDHYSFHLEPGQTGRLAAFFPQYYLEIGVKLASDATCDTPASGLGAGVSGQFGGRLNQKVALIYNDSPIGQDYIIQAFMPPFSPNIGDPCSDYELVLDIGPGGSVCEATANSTGFGCRMVGNFGTGNGSDVHLGATQGPPGQIGYVLVGSDFQGTGITPISNGFLCLTGQIGRYNFFGFPNDPQGNSGTQSLGSFDSNGVFQNQFGNSPSTAGEGFDIPSRLPFPGGPTITAGTSLTFQLWFRDNPAGQGQSNLSNAVRISF